MEKNIEKCGNTPQMESVAVPPAFPVRLAQPTHPSMKRSAILAIPCLFTLLWSLPAAAQIEHKVDRVKIKPAMQQTPVFNVSGPRDKRSKPREWLEIEVELQAETVKKSGYIDQLDVTFYVALKDVETQKTVVLEDTINFLEIDASERKAYVSAYISPATLRQMTGQRKPSLNDLYAVAVTVRGQGLRSEVTESTDGPDGWWTSSALQRRNNMVLPREKTAFAPLWWDFYPRAKLDN